MELVYLVQGAIIGVMLFIVIVGIGTLIHDSVQRRKKRTSVEVTQHIPEKEKTGLPTPPWGFEWVINSPDYNQESLLLWLVYRGHRAPTDITGHDNWTTLKLTGDSETDNRQLKFSAEFLVKKLSEAETTAKMGKSVRGRYSEGFEL